MVNFNPTASSHAGAAWGNQNQPLSAFVKTVSAVALLSLSLLTANLLDRHHPALATGIRLVVGACALTWIFSAGTRLAIGALALTWIFNKCFESSHNPTHVPPPHVPPRNVPSPHVPPRNVPSRNVPPHSPRGNNSHLPVLSISQLHSLWNQEPTMNLAPLNRSFPSVNRVDSNPGEPTMNPAPLNRSFPSVNPDSVFTQPSAPTQSSRVYPAPRQETINRCPPNPVYPVPRESIVTLNRPFPSVNRVDSNPGERTMNRAPSDRDGQPPGVFPSNVNRSTAPPQYRVSRQSFPSVVPANLSVNQSNDDQSNDARVLFPAAERRY
ncbi:MAG: hypothetical protein ACH350_06180 [Parachlamydiaceae bacterium]